MKLVTLGNYENKTVFIAVRFFVYTIFKIFLSKQKDISSNNNNK